MPTCHIIRVHAYVHNKYTLIHEIIITLQRRIVANAATVATGQLCPSLCTRAAGAAASSENLYYTHRLYDMGLISSIEELVYQENNVNKCIKESLQNCSACIHVGLEPLGYSRDGRSLLYVYV